MTRIILQTGIVYLLHIGIGVKVFGECHSILAVSLDSKSQCLHASQNQITVERRWRTAVNLRHGIAANPCDISSRTYHNSAQGISVTVDVLGHAMQHNISTKLQNMLNRRRSKGCIYYHADILACNRFDRCNVRNLYYRVIRCLKINHPGIGPDGCLQRLKVRCVHKGDFYAHVWKINCGYNVCAAVNVIIKNNMIAAF